MPKVSRITDMFSGICCCHPPIPCIGMTGKIIEGSPTHESAGQKVGRITDLVLGDCGHVGRIVTGSSSNKTNNLGKATIGSNVTGCLIGKIISGNPTHDTGL
jgi:hypothetical protein